MNFTSEGLSFAGAMFAAMIPVILFFSVTAWREFADRKNNKPKS